MSLLDNPKNFGLAAIIIGVVSLLVGIMAIVNGALADEIAFGAIVAAIGTILYGLLILGIGLPIFKGEITNSLSILGKFVRVIGLATIVVGIFAGAGTIIDGSLGGGITEIVIGLIFGLILIWVSTKILDGSVDLMDKIIWILLLIVFLILTIVSMVGIITPFLGGFSVEIVFLAILSLCQFILYAFLLFAVLSNDVKTAMGM